MTDKTWEKKDINTWIKFHPSEHFKETLLFIKENNKFIVSNYIWDSDTFCGYYDWKHEFDNEQEANIFLNKILKEEAVKVK